VISAPGGAPRYGDVSIGGVPTVARYDGLADWYEGLRPGLSPAEVDVLTRFLGRTRGHGRCLDLGCGNGVAIPRLQELGWSVVGVDASEDQLHRARDRGFDVVLADAERLPFDAGTFDAAVSLWTHTDLDDFGSVVDEVARVVRRGSPFVYVGSHPCFVGPHSRFVAGEGVPELHPGYRTTGRYAEGPGISPDGIRARVGASHLPLGLFLQTFLDAGFALERVEEPSDREYPYMLAVTARRSTIG
jgi:SAM-dependent methyltransferase